MKKDAPNSDLVNYIWDYLHKGYSLTSIRDSLVNQNYSIVDINYAVDYIYANHYYGKNDDSYRPNYLKTQVPVVPNSPGIHHVGLKSLIIMGIALIGFSFVFVLFLHLESENLNDSNIEVELDVPIKYSDNTPETEVVKSQNPSNPVVDLKPQKEVVSEKIIVPDRVYASDIAEVYDSGVSYTTRQLELKIEYFSSRNPKEAIVFCNAYTRDVEVDFCYRKIAINSGNPAYCDLVNIESSKDDCYLSCILENVDSGSVCNKIIEPKKKSNCFKIVDINEKAREMSKIKMPVDSEVTSTDDSGEYYAVVAEFY